MTKKKPLCKWITQDHHGDSNDAIVDLTMDDNDNENDHKHNTEMECSGMKGPTNEWKVDPDYHLNQQNSGDKVENDNAKVDADNNGKLVKENSSFNDSSKEERQQYGNELVDNENSTTVGSYLNDDGTEEKNGLSSLDVFMIKTSPIRRKNDKK
jgi:hypothetical protein